MLAQHLLLSLYVCCGIAHAVYQRASDTKRRRQTRTNFVYKTLDNIRTLVHSIKPLLCAVKRWSGKTDAVTEQCRIVETPVSFDGNYQGTEPGRSMTFYSRCHWLNFYGDFFAILVSPCCGQKYR